MGRTLGLAPDTLYVNEPDNTEADHADPFAKLAKRGMPRVPQLVKGDRADDYRLLWGVAFAGGWPRSHPVIAPMRRLGISHRLPATLRDGLHRRAARLASRRRPRHNHVIVKSVHGYGAAEWIASEFGPSIAVVWRHPLNLVAAWRERGWDRAAPPADLSLLGSEAFAARFEGTAVWPVGSAADPASHLAWQMCARSVMLMEKAFRNEWEIVSHEKQTLDPLEGFKALFERLGLAWTEEVAKGLTRSNVAGTGFSTNRVWKDEAQSWRTRLDPATVRAVTEMVERFATVSPSVGELWAGSPAVGEPSQPPSADIVPSSSDA